MRTLTNFWKFQIDSCYLRRSIPKTLFQTLSDPSFILFHSHNNRMALPIFINEQIYLFVQTYFTLKPQTSLFLPVHPKTLYELYRFLIFFMTKERVLQVSSTDRLFHSYKPMFYSSTILTDLETLHFPAQPQKHPSLKKIAVSSFLFGFFILMIEENCQPRVSSNFTSLSPPPPPSTQKITITDSSDYLF